MNMLSILIYVVEIVSRMGIAFALLSGGSLIISVFLIAVAGDHADSHPIIRNFFIAFFLFGTLAIFTPSQKTLYLIAASELGEAVATSEDGREVLQEMRRTVTEKLQELSSEKTHEE